MIYKEHLLELWVNGNKVELEDQKSLNMRFNNVLFDPTKISSTQAEYSFEFELPATPKNNIIFDYANNLSKLNKFHQRYNAEVYADGTVIFSGTITINSFKDNKYSVNLVSVKVYSLDDIFGDKTMNKIDWKIPFEGAGDGQYTIDWYNSQLDTDVTFPLVSYGAFQKNPKFKDDAASEYTSKFDFDEYNKWYIETFYPSTNVLETLRKAFETVGYTVGGDVFSNTYLKNIFMSTNLADEQDPQYNVGNPKFGKIDLSATFSTNSKIGYVQSLKFPYYKIGGVSEYVEGRWIKIEEGYNFEAVQLYDILAEGNVTVNQSVSYTYQPNEHIIVIPADGFYKIQMEIDTTLQTTNSLEAELNVRNMVLSPSLTPWLNNELDKEVVEFQPNFLTTTPVEIQLVRNYDDNLELIKGKNNMFFVDGRPDNEYPVGQEAFGQNKISTYTCFPHEKLGYFSDIFPIPTKTDDLGSSQQYTSNISTDGIVNGGADTMMYDPIVNPDFICGFSSMGNNNGSGSAAIIKNGYSWSKQKSEKFGSFYIQDGYYKVDRSGGTYPNYSYRFTPTEYNKNELYNSPTNYFTEFIGGTNMKGRLTAIVHLNKNDRLQLFCVHRDYKDGEANTVTYNSTTNVSLTIEAYSPKSYEQIKTNNDNDWLKPTQFDTMLNVANFFNKEKKISDWVQNVVDAFNLEVIQNGNYVEFNVKKNINDKAMIAVDIDDKVNSNEAESKMIEYPRSMAVKYKIDGDEWGFEQSAEKVINSDPSIDKTILDDEDEWKKYGDSGYTVIELNDDSYTTSTSDKNLQFSYTWYDNFNWYEVNRHHKKISNIPVVLKMPVISKYEYMIDGYDYTESLKHDGYGLAQRFWMKPEQTNAYVWTDVYPAQRVTVYLPNNLYTNYRDIYFNLSYKDTEPSILTNFFNINAYLSSNYVEVDVYLTPDEYNRIKNGSYVHMDSDIYIPVEISGYDPSGNNATTLKLIKKTN